MHYDEIIDYWGDHLVTFSQEALRLFVLSAEDKWFLTNIGVPMLGEDDFLRFAAPPEQLRLKFFQDAPFLIIGDDHGVEIGLNTQNRIVIEFPSLAYRKSRFMNSNLPLLIQCLTTFYREYYRNALILEAYTTEDQVTIDRFVTQFENELRQIDENAFSDPDHVWSLVAEQMSYGLL